MEGQKQRESTSKATARRGQLGRPKQEANRMQLGRPKRTEHRNKGRWSKKTWKGTPKLNAEEKDAKESQGQWPREHGRERQNRMLKRIWQKKADGNGQENLVGKTKTGGQVNAQARTTAQRK